MDVFKRVLDILLAFSHAFIKRLTLTSECAQGNFIEWVSVDILRKNDSAWILVLELSM